LEENNQMISRIRAEMATPDKNTGNEDQDLTSHPYKAVYESGDPHKGAITGTVEYFDGEFIVRLSVGGRDWNFRALDLGTLRDQVNRFFAAERGRIKLKLSKTADLARYGEHAAIARL
jgi:hypothetical protein